MEKNKPIAFVKNAVENASTKLKRAARIRSGGFGGILYIAFLLISVIAVFCVPVHATTTMWTKANDIMKDVYNQILLVSTIAAIVTASVALLLMNFSKSGKTVDESRAWLKRIIITWAILNGLGFIMAYVTPFFAGGKWDAGP